MTALRTDYQDDVLDTSVNTQRRFVVKDAATGTILNADVIIEEITNFTTEGDELGANIVNTQNAAINQINEDLIEIRRVGTMPLLNFANPLHTFSANNLTYTAVKECYLYGNTCTTSGTTEVSINGTPIAVGTSPTSGYVSTNIPYTKIKSGDIITVSQPCTRLHVFDVVN